MQGQLIISRRTTTAQSHPAALPVDVEADPPADQQDEADPPEGDERENDTEGDDGRAEKLEEVLAHGHEPHEIAVCGDRSSSDGRGG